MAEDTLAGVGVLVTRPRSQAGELIDAIEARGGSAVLFPAIEIIPRDSAAIAAQAAALADPDIVIFVSPNAVRFGIAHAPRVQLAAVGPKTARAIEAAGHNIDIAPASGFDSEHLLAEPALRNVSDKTVWVIRGQDGRELIAETLRSRGAIVEYLSVYERRIPDVTDAEAADIDARWHRGEIDVVTVMSVATLHNLVKLLPESARERLRRTPLVTPATRVLKEALDLFPGIPATLADGPDTDAMVRGIVALGLKPRGRTKMSDVDKDDEGKLASEEPDVSKESATGPEIHDEAKIESKPQSETKFDDTTTIDQQDAPVKKRAGRGIAWIALVFSLAALAALGYRFFEDWRATQTAVLTEDSIATLGSRIATSEASLSNLESRLTELAANNAQATSEIETLRRDFETRLQMLDTLPKRMSGLENSVASLQGISAGARDTWLLAEAEYYMQIANAQLQLAGNPQLAILALGMADERVTRIGDPGLTDVRRAILNELAALEVMEKPDIEGTTLTLASLARVIDSLPLQRMADAGTAESAAPESELSGVDRAWASVKRSVSGLVKITPPEQAEMPLITPDAIYFLRTNLTLQLQAARLALLRGEQAVFEQSLDDASAWLEQYFDTESTQVAAALATIDEIRGGMFSVTPPDISQSLRLLRQFRTLSESAQ